MTHHGVAAYLVKHVDERRRKMIGRTKTMTMLFLFAIATPLFAESGTFEHTHCYSGSPQTLKHNEGNVVNAVMSRGTLHATSPGQIFDNMSTQCVGIFGQVQGSTFSQGFCEFFDNEIDRILVRYERKGSEGAFQAVNGLGKYQGLTLEATYSVMRFPQTAGFLQGCAQNKGRWERK